MTLLYLFRIFSATASLESQIARLKNGKLFNISEQNFLDCSKTGQFIDFKGEVEPLKPGVIQAFQYVANGCASGNIDAVLQYAKYNGFLMSSIKPYNEVVRKIEFLI